MTKTIWQLAEEIKAGRRRLMETKNKKLIMMDELCVGDKVITNAGYQEVEEIGDDYIKYVGDEELDVLLTDAIWILDEGRK